MTGAKFISKYIGKNIDVDNYPNNQPYQCVDLIKGYIKYVIGVTPQSIGNAIDYWKKRNTSYLKHYFTPISNTPNFMPKAFDIVIFDKGNDTGHIAICTGEGNTKNFYIWQQNAPKKASPVNRACVNYKQVAGFLRPKHLEYYINIENATHIIKNGSCIYADSAKKQMIDIINVVNNSTNYYANVLNRRKYNSIIEYSDAPNGRYNVGIISNENLQAL